MPDPAARSPPGREVSLQGEGEPHHQTAETAPPRRTLLSGPTHTAFVAHGLCSAELLAC